MSDSEGTDTPGRPAGRERTAASDVPEFEFLAGAELLVSERRQDPGKGEIPVPGSVAVEEGRGPYPSPQWERRTVLSTVPPPSAIAVESTTDQYTDICLKHRSTKIFFNFRVFIKE